MKFRNIIAVACAALLLLPMSVLGQQKKLSGKALFGQVRARHIGPAVMSGRISSLAVVESDPTILYVGAAGGGVWKSISAGASLRPVFDDYTQSIGKITIDQARPDTVWVGTGEPWVRNSVSVGTGIYRSTDGGTSWEFKGLADSERISDIIIHPTEPNTVYVGVQGQLWSANEERGVYKTTDGGETWSRVLYIDENTGCADLDVDPENPDILYAAMWSHRRSPDFFDSGMKDKGGKSGLYKSTDGGKTWNTIQNGLPEGTLGRLAIAVAPSNGNTIYLSVEAEEKGDKGLYKSTDQGATWKQTSTEWNTTIRPFYFSNMVVDPNDEDKVLKCGLNTAISEDGGETFRVVGSGVHSDIHDIWVNSNNSKHVIVGTDGGVYESLDGGRLFKMWMNLPVSQFYHVSVDNDLPFNVYGGLQDNGSWYAPSRKAGGITNSDWKSTFGGDGFYSFRHPTDKDIIYSEYQGGNLIRYNKRTGMAKDIQPYPGEEDKKGKEEVKFRFNWNAPVHLSPNNTERMYFASQFLFMTEDRGDTWTRLSDDLTTDTKDWQQQHKSGGLSIDNSTAENHCTIYTIAESPVDENIIWVGTDDGNLQVTKNQGKKWSNVVSKVPGLPENTWVVFIEPSPHDANTAFVVFDGHRRGDKKTYIYKTTDLGKTWTNLGTQDLEGYALSVRQDFVNPNLIFLGTEFGLYLTIDGGTTWSRFENNMPKVGVRDMVIHKRDNSLVMGTHGRGVIIIDDISPMRQINDEILAKKVHFFDTKPTVLRDPGAGGGWFGGAGNFVGSNPSRTAKIIYYMSRRHTFGKMYFEIYDSNDNLIKELPAGKRAGINIVEMPTSLRRPKAAPSNNRMALFGSMFGPNLLAGEYKVKLVKGKEEFWTSFQLVNDPESIYADGDRITQRETAMRLYTLSEELAYFHASLTKMKTKAEEHAKDNEALAEQLNAFAEKTEAFMNDLTFTGGDFYVDEEERIRETISNLYRQVSSYPGKPSNSHLMRTKILEDRFDEVRSRFDTFIQNDFNETNNALEGAGLQKIKIETLEEFKAS